MMSSEMIQPWATMLIVLQSIWLHLACSYMWTDGPLHILTARKKLCKSTRRMVALGGRRTIRRIVRPMFLFNGPDWMGPFLLCNFVSLSPRQTRRAFHILMIFKLKLPINPKNWEELPIELPTGRLMEQDELQGLRWESANLTIERIRRIEIDDTEAPVALKNTFKPIALKWKQRVCFLDFRFMLHQ